MVTDRLGRHTALIEVNSEAAGVRVSEINENLLLLSA